MHHTEPIIDGIYTCTADYYTPFECEVQVNRFTKSDVFYTYVSVTDRAKHNHRKIGSENSVSRETFSDHFVLVRDTTPEELPEEIELTPMSFNDLFH